MDYLDQVDLAVFYSMDKKERTFKDKSVPEIQRDFFLRDMPENGYLSNFPRGTLPSNKTLVLFHFDRQVIASAIFLKQLTINDSEYQYASYFVPDSIMVYTETIVIEELRKVSSKIVNFQSFMPHIKEESIPLLITLLRNREKRCYNVVLDPAAVEQFSMEIESGMDDLSSTEKLTMIKLRVGQSIFKDRLLQQRQKCDLCGLTNVRLLRASHIKQWSSCKDSNERLDPENGLLLCPNHDQIFDSKLISFDDAGNILMSPMLTDLDRNFLNIDEFRRLNLSEKKSGFMQWHRQEFLSMHESE